MPFDDDDERYCPNCGTNLDEQSSFDEDANVNIYEHCGQELQIEVKRFL